MLASRQSAADAKQAQLKVQMQLPLLLLPGGAQSPRPRCCCCARCRPRMPRVKGASGTPCCRPHALLRRCRSSSWHPKHRLPHRWTSCCCCCCCSWLGRVCCCAAGVWSTRVHPQPPTWRRCCCCWALPLWRDAVGVVKVWGRLRAAADAACCVAVGAGAYDDCLHGDVVHGDAHSLARAQGGCVGYTAGVALHSSRQQ
jgi:hypothetical protein